MYRSTSTSAGYLHPISPVLIPSKVSPLISISFTRFGPTGSQAKYFIRFLPRPLIHSFPFASSLSRVEFKWLAPIKARSLHRQASKLLAPYPSIFYHTMKPSSVFPIGLVSAFLILGWCITRATARFGFPDHLFQRRDIAGAGVDDDGATAATTTGDVVYEGYGGPMPENKAYEYYTTYGYGQPPPPPAPVTITIIPSTSPSSLTSSSTSTSESSSSSAPGMIIIPPLVCYFGSTTQLLTPSISVGHCGILPTGKQHDRNRHRRHRVVGRVGHRDGHHHD